MNRLLSILLVLTLTACAKGEQYYRAPASSCNVERTGKTRVESKKKCVKVGDNSCAHKKTVYETEVEYEYQCKWREFD